MHMVATSRSSHYSNTKSTTIYRDRRTSDKTLRHQFLAKSLTCLTIPIKIWALILFQVETGGMQPWMNQIRPIMVEKDPFLSLNHKLPYLDKSWETNLTYKTEVKQYKTLQTKQIKENRCCLLDLKRMPLELKKLLCLMQLSK